MRGAVYMCPVCFFSFGRRGFLFFTAQRCVVYSYSIHLICAHLSYMRIIKQLRRKVRKWAVCVNDRRMRKTLKNPRSTHRHTLAHNWAVKQKAMFYTIHREGVYMDSGEKEKYNFSFFFLTRQDGKWTYEWGLAASCEIWYLWSNKTREKKRWTTNRHTRKNKGHTHTHTQKMCRWWGFTTRRPVEFPTSALCIDR